MSDEAARADRRRRPLVERAAARVVAALLRALGATWRVEVRSDVPIDAIGRGAGALVGALWHESWPIAAHHFRDRGIAMAVSRSRDGDRVALVLARLGYGEPVRGSSSRGAAVMLRELVARVRAGAAVAVLADGPRGPARSARPGAARAAALARAPFVVVGCAARPALRLPTWDALCLPLPFARIAIDVAAARPGDERELGDALEAARARAEEVVSRRRR